MASNSIDGKHIAQNILTALKSRTALQSLQLAAILIGNDPGLKKFVGIKKKAAESAGITFSSYEFADGASVQEILDTIEYLNRDSSVQGIFVELPLPQKYDRDAILNAIDPIKDVDVISAAMQKNFYANTSKILPPAVGALQAVLKECTIDLKGKQVALFGHGFLVGKPIAHWIHKKGAHVQIIDEHTSDPSQYSLVADVIITAVGKPNILTGAMVRENAVVIDYGFEKHADRVVGDVDFLSVAPKALLITPVPGGMGPIVVAAVLENLTLLAK